MPSPRCRRRPGAGLRRSVGGGAVQAGFRWRAKEDCHAGCSGSPPGFKGRSSARPAPPAPPTRSPTCPPNTPRLSCPPPGEKLALAANGRGGLATCALRPSGIFGEHDTLLVSGQGSALRCLGGGGRGARMPAAAAAAARSGLRARPPARPHARTSAPAHPSPACARMPARCLPPCATRAPAR